MRKFIHIALLFCLLAVGWPALGSAQNINEAAKREITSQTNPLKTEGAITQPPVQSVIEEQEKKTNEAGGGVKFLVGKIIFKGNTRFSEAVLRRVIHADQLEGKTLSVGDLQNAADKITAYYRAHGYTLTYAYLPVQKVNNGEVMIAVLEVRTGKIKVVGNRYFSEQLFRRALKLDEGDYFRMWQVERALNQINSQPDRYAKAYLEPGAAAGTTDVTMKVADQMPLHASFEYNLRGNNLTGGRSRYVLHLTDNNLTGHGDSLQSAFDLAEEGALYAAALHYELPVVDTEDVFHTDFSYAISKLRGDLRFLDVEGKAINFIPGYTHNLMDTGDMKLDLDMRFELKDCKIDVLDSKLSFDRTRVLVGGPRVTFNDDGGRTVAQMDVHGGLPDFWGSLSEKDSLSSRPDSGGGFVYETVNAARVQKLPYGMSLILQAAGQYSAVSLPSIEQMYLGGMYSVRGYPEDDSAGDIGFSFSQELRLPLSFIPENWQVWGHKDKAWRNTLFFAAFIDEGRVFDHVRIPGEARDRTLLGAGPGLRFYASPDLNLQFDLGFPFGDTSSNKHGVEPDLSVRVGF